MPHEKKLMDQVTDEYNRYWLPIHWSCTIVQKCREDNHIKNDAQTNGLLKEIINFRSNLQVLCNYDWVRLYDIHFYCHFLGTRSIGLSSSCFYGRPSLLYNLFDL